eukprot:scaffold8007_cov78-Skeletonema_dohrnii-CCMP3373.AAC.3
MLTAGTGRPRFLYDSSLTGRSTIVVVFVVAPIYIPPNSNNNCWSVDRLEIGGVLLLLVLVDCCVRSEPTEGRGDNREPMNDNDGGDYWMVTCTD